jgi:tRNA-2-methylthio-N6-dimethylallyladenosine synthase
VRDLPKVCKHMHLPVQSGSTRVLQAMRRRYTREAYLDLVAAIRAAIPAATLSTDMIVGFPGETADDFEQTLSLTDAAQYHSMFSFKYSERPNTLASRRLADDVSEAEKTRRIVALQALQRDIQSRLHEAAVGTTMAVLVDAVSRRRDGEMSGRTGGNTVVNFPVPGQNAQGGAWLGRTVQVTIRRAGPNSLWGEVTHEPISGWHGECDGARDERVNAD